jgi:hypothetical protein
MKKLDQLTFEPISFVKAWEGTNYGKIPKRDYDLQRERIVPGAVLKMATGEVYLVGHCSTLLGTCDHCKDYALEDIVAIAHIKELGIDV